MSDGAGGRGQLPLYVLLSVSEQAWVLVLVGGRLSLLFVLQPKNGVKHKL